MVLSSFTLLRNHPPSLPSACCIFRNWNSVPIKQHPPIPPAPSSHWPTFCLCEFDSSKCLVWAVLVFSWLAHFIQRGVLKARLRCGTCQDVLPFKASDASPGACTTAGSPAGRHLGHFHVLAAEDVGVQVSLWDSAFGSSGYAPRGGRPSSDSLRSHCAVVHSSGSVVHSLQRCTRVPVPVSPHPCQHVFFPFVTGALLMDFFGFHFPNDELCWMSFHFTHGLLIICTSSFTIFFGEISTESFAKF